MAETACVTAAASSAAHAIDQPILTIRNGREVPLWRMCPPAAEVYVRRTETRAGCYGAGCNVLDVLRATCCVPVPRAVCPCHVRCARATCGVPVPRATCGRTHAARRTLHVARGTGT